MSDYSNVNVNGPIGHMGDDNSNHTNITNIHNGGGNSGNGNGGGPKIDENPLPGFIAIALFILYGFYEFNDVIFNYMHILAFTPVVLMTLAITTSLFRENFTKQSVCSYLFTIFSSIGLLAVSVLNQMMTPTEFITIAQSEDIVTFGKAILADKNHEATRPFLSFFLLGIAVSINNISGVRLLAQSLLQNNDKNIINRLYSFLAGFKITLVTVIVMLFGTGAYLTLKGFIF